MSIAPAPAPLVSAIRSAKDAYFAGGELTIHEMTVLRIYFKRILAKRNTPEADRLRAQVDGLLHSADVTRWLAEARSAGIYVFGNVPRKN